MLAQKSIVFNESRENFILECHVAFQDIFLVTQFFPYVLLYQFYKVEMSYFYCIFFQLIRYKYNEGKSDWLIIINFIMNFQKFLRQVKHANLLK